MMRNENDTWGVGLHISRTINGEIVRMDRLDAGIEKRIKMIAELNTQYETLIAANDMSGLIALADKYARMKMHATARKIRRQVNG